VSRALGAQAEARAAQFLQRKGYRILARNWCCRGGEIDLVCDDGGTIVFVEVRARQDSRHGSPGETVGGVKRARLVRAAQLWLLQAKRGDVPCRFDVLALEGDKIEHIEDAFTTD
jgi:putative endonuclease